jgi:hypothetical protein
VDANVVTSHIAGLLSRSDIQVTIPNPATPGVTDASAFAQKAKALRDKILEEFCFYHRRYRWGLNSLLNQAVGFSTSAAANADSTYTTKRANLVRINARLNDMIELMKGLSTNANTALNGYYSANGGINALNSQLQTTRNQLMASSKMLQSSDLEVEVKKAMIDYTLEKNSASRNMLGIYVFMNVVAGGLLYYLYRSI